MAVENVKTYNEYVDKLAEASGIKIATFTDLMMPWTTGTSFFMRMAAAFRSRVETIIAEIIPKRKLKKSLQKSGAGPVYRLKK
jgi:glucuronate isomerase